MLLYASVVPHILGPEYERTVEALRWLAPFPFLKKMHYLFLLRSPHWAGYQGLRSGIQADVAFFNLLINFG